MTSSLHDDFKIITNGRELPFPLMRILTLMLVAFVMGYGLALFDVANELHRRFPHGIVSADR